MSNYLNHLVARSLNLIDTVQPLLVSVFEPLPEFAGLVEEADFNSDLALLSRASTLCSPVEPGNEDLGGSTSLDARSQFNGEQLPVADTSEENNFETERQARTSPVSGIEQWLEWRSPATFSIPDRDLYTTASASLNIEPHSVTKDIFEPNENQYNLQTPDELNYPRSLDLTPTLDRDSGQLPTSTSELAELANSELPPSQPLSEPVAIPPAHNRGLPTPNRQPLMPAIEPETNASLASSAAESKQQPTPDLSQKQPIEINRVVSSSRSSEEVTSESSSSQLQPELVVIQPATHKLSSTLDRQALTGAIAQEPHTAVSSFSTEQQQQPVPKSENQQSTEINRVVFLLQASEESGWQLSPSQPQPEPVVLQLTTDTQKMPPSPDKQLLTGAIAQEPHTTFSSFSAQQQQQPVPKFENQQSMEINRVVFLLQASEESGWQLSPSQPQPEPVALQLTTDTQKMPSSPDKQLLTGAIAIETNASLTSRDAEPQQNSVPELSQKQPIEINRIVSISDESEVLSQQSFSSQPQPQSVVISPATERVQPTLDRQALSGAIAQEPHTAVSSFSAQQQQQPVPKSENQQSMEINRVVSLLQASEESGWQLSPNQPQPKPMVIPLTTEMMSPTPAIQRESNAVLSSTTKQQGQPARERVLLTSDRQALTPAIATKTVVAPSSPSAEQQRQPVPESSQKRPIEINRVVSSSHSLQLVSRQLSPSQPQSEPGVIQQEGRRQRADRRRIFSKADSSSLLEADREQGFESPPVTSHQEPTDLVAARLSAIPIANLTGHSAIASVVVQPEINFSSWHLPDFPKHEGRTKDQRSTSSEITEIPQLSPSKTPLWIDKARQETILTFDNAPVRFGKEELPQHRESPSNSPIPQNENVQVTIGCLEIRAIPPVAPPQRKSRPASPVMSLDEYLRRRAGGGKR